jgi:alkaline phosphatase D
MVGGGLLAPGWLSRAPFAQTGSRPGIPYGVQSGDVGPHQAVVWSATDRPGRMVVEYATTESFGDARRIAGPAALPEGGFTAKVVLTGLPAGQDVFYRVTFLDLADLKTASVPVIGHFRTAPADGRDVSFVWSGDRRAGMGINADRGGKKIYETMPAAGLLSTAVT